MSPLPSLPPEIFLSIKDSIPSSDLRTHVCFYRTSTSIAQLYDSIDHSDDFWARACWACGLTRPTGKTSERPDTAWRDFAIGARERCGFCKNNQCGEALLERNRECSVAGDAPPPGDRAHSADEGAPQRDRAGQELPASTSLRTLEKARWCGRRGGTGRCKTRTWRCALCGRRRQPVAQIRKLVHRCTSNEGPVFSVALS